MELWGSKSPREAMRRKTYWMRTAAQSFSKKSFTCEFIFGRLRRKKRGASFCSRLLRYYLDSSKGECAHGDIRRAPRHRDRPGRSEVSARSGAILDRARHRENEGGGCGRCRTQRDAGGAALESLRASDRDSGDFRVRAGLSQTEDSAHGSVASGSRADALFP